MLNEQYKLQGRKKGKVEVVLFYSKTGDRTAGQK